MGTRTENVDIDKEMYDELIEKLASTTTEEEQSKLMTEYYSKIFITRDE